MAVCSLAQKLALRKNGVLPRHGTPRTRNRRAYMSHHEVFPNKAIAVFISGGDVFHSPDGTRLLSETGRDSPAYVSLIMA